MTEEPSHSEHRRRHYGRRKGPKLRARQAGLLRDLLPQLTLIPKPGLDPRRYFTSSSWPPGGAAMTQEIKDVWLEVGFGAGEHLVWQAEANPDVGLIGAEPYISGLAKLLSKIAAQTPTRSTSPRALPLAGGGKEFARAVPPPERERLGGGRISNIRLYPKDARDVIAALPAACLSRVFILFPDPWPKARHHKRRFLQMAMLDELARVMKEGAELRFATDDRGYLLWALERLMAHPQFIWSAQAPADWRTRPPDWPQTRYEAKALKAGHACIYLGFCRV